MENYIVTFCICTYNRNKGVTKLLESINNICLPDNIDFSKINVIVVDNYDGLSKKVIKNENYKFHIEWYYEPKKGLCFARNKTVELAKNTEYCLFVDDDQIIDNNCVLELLQTGFKHNADLVYGSNPPKFIKKVSRSIEYYFLPKIRAKQDYIINNAPTNCTLVKKSALDEIEGPFDFTFNLTGGEDSYMTRQLSLKGKVMYKCIKAKAYEIVPPERCSLLWITKRAFRCSSSVTVQDRMLKLGLYHYTKRSIKAIIKILFGIIIFFPMLFFPYSFKYKYYFWIHMVEGLGQLLGFVNIHPKEYNNIKS
jgi:glycosyltransferase involved in cell wall biosynthesis